MSSEKMAASLSLSQCVNGTEKIVTKYVARIKTWADIKMGRS